MKHDEARYTGPRAVLTADEEVRRQVLEITGWDVAKETEPVSLAVILDTCDIIGGPVWIYETADGWHITASGMVNEAGAPTRPPR